MCKTLKLGSGNFPFINICAHAMRKNILLDIDTIIFKGKIHILRSGKPYSLESLDSYGLYLDPDSKFYAYGGPIPEEIINICV
jgi:hypothetical protein